MNHLTSFGQRRPTRHAADRLHRAALGLLAAAAEKVDPTLAKVFFFKGTNGRWKEVLSAAELALYEGLRSARWRQTVERS